MWVSEVMSQTEIEKKNEMANFLEHSRGPVNVLVMVDCIKFKRKGPTQIPENLLGDDT
jgi:hypothetical protein